MSIYLFCLFGDIKMSIFSERIKYLKTSKKLLQKDIAKSIGISLRAYQYYETGQMEPTMSVLVSLADFFNVSLDYLTGRTDEPINPYVKRRKQ